jgi:hypothetical protein
MAKLNLKKIKKQFEEVSNMLDKLVGGKTATSLFAVDTANIADRNCSTFCQDKCSGSIGSYTGQTSGTVVDNPIKPIVGDTLTTAE